MTTTQYNAYPYTLFTQNEQVYMYKNILLLKYDDKSIVIPSDDKCTSFIPRPDLHLVKGYDVSELQQMPQYINTSHHCSACLYQPDVLHCDCSAGQNCCNDLTCGSHLALVEMYQCISCNDYSDLLCFNGECSSCITTCDTCEIILNKSDKLFCSTCLWYNCDDENHTEHKCNRCVFPNNTHMLIDGIDIYLSRMPIPTGIATLITFREHMLPVIKSIIYGNHTDKTLSNIYIYIRIADQWKRIPAIAFKDNPSSTLELWLKFCSI